MHCCGGNSNVESLVTIVRLIIVEQIKHENASALSWVTFCCREGRGLPQYFSANLLCDCLVSHKRLKYLWSDYSI